ncbi:MAG: hypothetical protein K2J80_13570 [Oscillospiraceae bacterium]|nr:hypothetical protein [Oscillospiraceae bacterium]
MRQRHKYALKALGNTNITSAARSAPINSNKTNTHYKRTSTNSNITNTHKFQKVSGLTFRQRYFAKQNQWLVPTHNSVTSKHKFQKVSAEAQRRLTGLD